MTEKELNEALVGFLNAGVEASNNVVKMYEEEIKKSTPDTQEYLVLTELLNQANLLRGFMEFWSHNFKILPNEGFVQVSNKAFAEVLEEKDD